ncbi:hypothetical protein SDJN02_14013, partial [Cucurbita argyrosperma subsp. argyrosperma]
MGITLHLALSAIVGEGIYWERNDWRELDKRLTRPGDVFPHWEVSFAWCMHIDVFGKEQPWIVGLCLTFFSGNSFCSSRPLVQDVVHQMIMRPCLMCLFFYLRGCGPSPLLFGTLRLVPDVQACLKEYLNDLVELFYGAGSCSSGLYAHQLLIMSITAYIEIRLRTANLLKGFNPESFCLMLLYCFHSVAVAVLISRWASYDILDHFGTLGTSALKLPASESRHCDFMVDDILNLATIIAYHGTRFDLLDQAMRDNYKKLRVGERAVLIVLSAISGPPKGAVKGWLAKRSHCSLLNGTLKGTARLSERLPLFYILSSPSLKPYDLLGLRLFLFLDLFFANQPIGAKPYSPSNLLAIELSKEQKAAFMVLIKNDRVDVDSIPLGKELGSTHSDRYCWGRISTFPNRAAGVWVPHPASQVYDITHESGDNAMSPTQSPPLQTMDRVGGYESYDPSRIPSAVFQEGSQTELLVFNSPPEVIKRQEKLEMKSVEYEEEP